MSIITPPIKSQGIKTKLVPKIMQLKPIFSGRWIEPFLGTGVVAFNSGEKRTLLSDINPHIINFYSKLQSGKINSMNVREYLNKEGQNLRNEGENAAEYYNFIRNRFNTCFDSLDFLFLSRAGFNGMIRFNKNGKWNIPFCKKPERFDKSYITKIVHQVENCKAVMTDDWTFENKDFREIISQATENDFIYCDPPYAGRYVDYYSGWSDKDEDDLFELLSVTKSKFILSSWHHNSFRENDNLKKYEEKFNILTQEHFYFAGPKKENRNAMTEALILNYDITEKITTQTECCQTYLFPEVEFA